MAPAARSRGERNWSRSTPPSRIVNMAPTASKADNASRLQPRRQSLPSWVAVKPSRDAGAAVAPGGWETAREPAICHNGRQANGAATRTAAHGATHHQLSTGLTESDSGREEPWVPTTDTIYTESFRF